MVTQGYRQLCIFMYQIKILVLRRTSMMLLGLVKMVLGFRRESYLEQGMSLDGVDAAKRMLEFIHKYGFVSSNSFYWRKLSSLKMAWIRVWIAMGKNGVFVNPNLEMSWLQRLSCLLVALMPAGAALSSMSSLGSNVLFTKWRLFPSYVALTVFGEGHDKVWGRQDFACRHGLRPASRWVGDVPNHRK